MFSISYSLGIASFNSLSIFIIDICELLCDKHLGPCSVPLHSLSESCMFSLILDLWTLFSPLCMHTEVSV